MCFDCTNPDATIRSRIRFVDAFPIESPASWEEICSLSMAVEKLLVIGVVDWSVYSHMAMRFLVRHWYWFQSDGIGLAAFCLCDDAVVEAVCPAFLPVHRTMTNEPAMLVVEKGSLRQIRAGPIRPEAIMPWVLWDGRGSPPSSKLLPPSDSPLWDEDIDGLPTPGNDGIEPREWEK